MTPTTYPQPTTLFTKRVPTFDHRKYSSNPETEKKLDEAQKTINNLKFNIDCLTDQNKSLAKLVAEGKADVDSISLKMEEKELEHARTVQMLLYQLKQAEAARDRAEIIARSNAINKAKQAAAKASGAIKSRLYGDRSGIIELKPAEEIIQIIEKYLAVTVEEMHTMNRKRELVYARHIACYFLATYTRVPMVRIAEMITGKPDHTFVVNGRESIKERMKLEVAVANNINDITKLINI